VIEQPSDGWAEPWTGEELADDPIHAMVAARDEDELPAGVFDAHATHPAARFTLSESAQRELEEVCALSGHPVDEVALRFSPEALEQARGLKAAHASKHRHAELVVGQDVADQLAADTIHDLLERHRELAQARQATVTDDNAGAGAGAQDGTAPPGGEAGGPSPEEREARQVAQRRAEREAEQEARRQAVAYNAELGAAVLKRLAKVRVDEPVLQILTAVDLHGQLDGIAARGARYCFPGWPQESQTKSAKTKVEYLPTTEAGGRAREFLAGAKSTADIAGRSIAFWCAPTTPRRSAWRAPTRRPTRCAPAAMPTGRRAAAVDRRGPRPA